MKKSIFVIALILLFNSAYSQSENYKDVLLEYMEVQGSLDTFNANISQMAKMVGGQIDDEKLKPVFEEMFAELINTMVPIYQNHFSIQDLKDGIQMYKTPIGKKIAEKTPLITQEIMGASIELGMKFATRLQEVMQK